jgi:hypothetical protein
MGYWTKQGWKTFKTMRFDLGSEAKKVEGTVLRWLRQDLGLPPYLSEEECRAGGWTETVCAETIDLPTLWDRVVEETSKLRDH